MTFCHFDEYEDTVLSIELAAEKFRATEASPTAWKWVITAMQNAVQGAMVLVLAGPDECGALDLKSQRKNREWLANLTNQRPRQQMADFNTLLARIQSPALLSGPVPSLTGEDQRNLERLNELRRQFAHYNPVGWGIELRYLLNILPVAVRVFEHLVTTQGRANLHYSSQQNRRIKDALTSILAGLAVRQECALPRLDHASGGDH